MGASPVVRGMFTDYYGSTMLPALEYVIQNAQQARPDEYVSFFKVEDTTKSIVQASEVTGLGTFVQITEGGNTRYDAPLPAFSKTWTPVDWSLGVRFSHRLIADDQFGIMKDVARSLVDSAKETYEIQAAAVYNDGFTTNGPDGTTLFSTAHPKVGGGTQRNRPSVDVDLDIASLESALTDFRRFTDHRGLRKRLIPRWLVIPPELEFAAREIMMSPMRSDTANNTVNAFRSRDEGPTLIPKVWNYLTDNDAWFIVGEEKDLNLRFIWRERFSTMHDVDFDSRSVKTAGWMTFDVGYSSWVGCWGTTGA